MRLPLFLVSFALTMGQGFTNSAVIQDALEKKEVTQGPSMDWKNYQRFDTISDFVTTSALAHSDIASVEEIGKTFENRSMIVVKIGRSVQNKTKPAIFIEAGIHPNEWISPAVATYFINQSLNNYSYYEEMLEQVDLYILPVANPDGYEFSHTDERMWRKNRRPDPECPGAFSEPETMSIRDFIERKMEEGVSWRAYYALHSYSQIWLLPWGWTSELPEDFEELKRFGDVGIEALTLVHGTHYDISTAAEFEPGPGGSSDWAKGSGIFKYSQTLELRDTGEFGFLLPPEQIIPTGEETWAAIQANVAYLCQ